MQTTTHTSPSAPCTERDHSSEIGLLAYHLWEVSGCPAGRDVDLWLQAEQQLLGLSHLNGSTPPSRSTPKHRASPVRPSKRRAPSTPPKAAGTRAKS